MVTVEAYLDVSLEHTIEGLEQYAVLYRYLQHTAYETVVSVFHAATRISKEQHYQLNYF